MTRQPRYETSARLDALRLSMFCWQQGGYVDRSYWRDPNSGEAQGLTPAQVRRSFAGTSKAQLFAYHTLAHKHTHRGFVPQATAASVPHDSTCQLCLSKGYAKRPPRRTIMPTWPMVTEHGAFATCRSSRNSPCSHPLLARSSHDESEQPESQRSSSLADGRLKFSLL